MDILDPHELESTLGICDPWCIGSVTTNDDSKIIDVHLEIKNQKRHFSLFGSNNNQDLGTMTSGKWSYMPVGRFRSVIHASIPLSFYDANSALSRTLINQCAFLGHPKRQYSNFIRQQVALYQVRGVDTKLLSEIYHIDQKLIDSAIKDLSGSSERLKSLVYLPTESDPIWSKILLDRQLIHTNLLPLKLLLSKLKLSSINVNSSDNLAKNALELRKFIVANAHLLASEVDQLSGIVSEKSKQQASLIKSKQSLVLPSIKNPLWLGVLSGKLQLNSQSLPLNLLISKQKMLFLNASDTQRKLSIINQLRNYFRKNYRTLKPELLLINRMMAIKRKSSDDIDLPNLEHRVWQEILDSDDVVPSDHVAYNLLLARLRMQMTSKLNPVVRLDAARYIRGFIEKNKRVMHKELNSLLTHSKTG